MLSNLKEGLKSLTLRAEATDGPNLFSKVTKKYALETLGNEGQNTNRQSMIIFQPQLTLTNAASASEEPLATRRTEEARPPLPAQQRGQGRM